MKATFTNPAKESFTSSHRKEDRGFQKEYAALAIVDGQIHEFAVLRVYGTESANSVCFWMNGKSVSGSGKAGGYGYHRPSQAASQAFKRAGFQFDEHIEGRGDDAIKRALQAAIECLYGIPQESIYIHEAHA